MAHRQDGDDVIVVGGGTAGFGAALAAARQGARVRLIEAGDRLGGVMAFCPGMPWGGAYPCDVHIGGIMQELTESLAGMVPPAAEKRPCTLENFGPEIVYDPDMAQIVMHDMLHRAGVEVQLGTTALDPVLSGSRIEAIRLAGRRGTQELAARMVIDCSGDGELSARAGVPFDLGDSAGRMMAVSLTFLMVGAPWDEVFAEGDPYFRRHAARGVASGRLHPDLARIYMMRGFHRDTVFCNSVAIRGVDGTDPADVARATQEGRRRCRQLAEFLRAEVPGFADAWMASLGPTVGVRESRKLHGLYRLSAADVAAARKFDDGIVACANPVDDVMRGAGDMTHDAAVDDGAWYTLPFRALVPAAPDNLLFAGRIVSADPVAFASIRGMPQCMAMGQAAGTAAAMALAAGLPVQSLDPVAVARAMRAQGLRGIAGDTLTAPA